MTREKDQHVEHDEVYHDEGGWEVNHEDAVPVGVLGPVGDVSGGWRWVEQRVDDHLGLLRGLGGRLSKKALDELLDQSWTVFWRANSKPTKK